MCTCAAPRRSARVFCGSRAGRALARDSVWGALSSRTHLVQLAHRVRQAQIDGAPARREERHVRVALKQLPLHLHKGCGVQRAALSSRTGRDWHRRLSRQCVAAPGAPGGVRGVAAALTLCMKLPHSRRRRRPGWAATMSCTCARTHHHPSPCAPAQPLGRHAPARVPRSRCAPSSASPTRSLSDCVDKTSRTCSTRPGSSTLRSTWMGTSGNALRPPDASTCKGAQFTVSRASYDDDEGAPQGSALARAPEHA